MGNWRTPIIGVCACFVLIGVLLTILLVVMSHHPEDKLNLAATDMRILSKVSSIWCGWQEVSSSHPITVYRSLDQPTSQLSPVHQYQSKHDLQLHFGKERYLKYFFLSGSSVQLKGCANRKGVYLRVFQNMQKWKNCLQMRRLHPFQSEDSSSSEESEEEEEWNKYSLRNLFNKKMGKWSHGWYPTNCDQIKILEIPFTEKNCPTLFLSLNISNADNYIFSFEDYHSSPDESKTNILMTTNRTIYNLVNSPAVCHTVMKCDVSLSFGSDEHSIVYIDAETDAGAVSYTVIATCKPRIFFFLFLFALVPLIVLTCVGCAIMLCENKKKKTTVKYIQVSRNEEDANTPHCPLLAGPEVTIYSRPQFQKPIEPPSYSTCSAPPSYTSAVNKTERED